MYLIHIQYAMLYYVFNKIIKIVPRIRFRVISLTSYSIDQFQMFTILATSGKLYKDKLRLNNDSMYLCEQDVELRCPVIEYPIVYRARWICCVKTIAQGNQFCKSLVLIFFLQFPLGILLVVIFINDPFINFIND